MGGRKGGITIWYKQIYLQKESEWGEGELDEIIVWNIDSKRGWQRLFSDVGAGDDLTRIHCI